MHHKPRSRAYGTTRRLSGASGAPSSYDGGCTGTTTGTSRPARWRGRSSSRRQCACNPSKREHGRGDRLPARLVQERLAGSRRGANYDTSRSGKKMARERNAGVGEHYSEYGSNIYHRKERRHSDGQAEPPRRCLTQDMEEAANDREEADMDDDCTASSSATRTAPRLLEHKKRTRRTTRRNGSGGLLGAPRRGRGPQDRQGQRRDGVRNEQPRAGWRRSSISSARRGSTRRPR